MMIDGKTYSWESLEIAIDAAGFESIDVDTLQHCTPEAPMLITVTLPTRLRDVPVEFAVKYDDNPIYSL